MDVTIDHVGWNSEAVKSMTRREFVTSPQHKAFYGHLSDKEAEKALEAVYDHIVPPKKLPEKPTDNK